MENRRRIKPSDSLLFDFQFFKDEETTLQGTISHINYFIRTDNRSAYQNPRKDPDVLA